MRAITNSADVVTKRRRLAMLRALLLAGLVFASFVLTACQDGVTDPNTPQATRIAILWWVLLGVSAFVFFAVMVFLTYALFRPRDRPSVFERRPRVMLWFIVTAGGIIPVFILLGVFGFSLWPTVTWGDVDENPLEVTVIGHNWWWEFQVPEAGVTTVNELHVPVDRDVKFTVYSDDVIHSFWVPELNGKIDAFPDIRNILRIRPTDPGVYRGTCAEFCGVGHTCMVFFITVEQPGDFQSWLELKAATPFVAPDPEELLLECVRSPDFKPPPLQPEPSPLSSPTAEAAGAMREGR